MAYDFNGTNQLFYTTSAPRTTTPITLACWVNADTFGSDGQNDHYAALGSSSTDGEFSLGFYNDAGTPFAEFACDDSAGAGSYCDATATPTSGTWEHYCGTMTDATHMAMYLNGGNKGTLTTDRVPSINAFDIGAFYNGGTTVNYANGKIAEVAIWDVGLTDAEVATLSKGYSPLFVRPASLVFYSPLTRLTQDLIGAQGFTAVNSPTVYQHPRIIYPTMKQIRKYSTPAVASAIKDLIMSGMIPFAR